MKLLTALAVWLAFAASPEDKEGKEEDDVAPEVWQGYNRHFAHEYLRRFGHWSTKEGDKPKRPFYLKPKSPVWDIGEGKLRHYGKPKFLQLDTDWGVFQPTTAGPTTSGAAGATTAAAGATTAAAGATTGGATTTAGAGATTAAGTTGAATTTVAMTTTAPATTTMGATTTMMGTTTAMPSAMSMPGAMPGAYGARPAYNPFRWMTTTPPIYTTRMWKSTPWTTTVAPQLMHPGFQQAVYEADKAKKIFHDARVAMRVTAPPPIVPVTLPPSKHKDRLVRQLRREVGAAADMASAAEKNKYLDSLSQPFMLHNFTRGINATVPLVR